MPITIVRQDITKTANLYLELIAADETKIEAALRAVAVNNEAKPTKTDWNWCSFILSALAEPCQLLPGC
jgi:hypothetical protein